MKKLTAIICLVFAIIMLFSLPMSVGASEPYKTYTYSISGTSLGSPSAYTPAKTIDGQKMGLTIETISQYYPEYDISETNPNHKINRTKLEQFTKLNNPSDIEVDDQGNIYIADTDNATEGTPMELTAENLKNNCVCYWLRG